MLELLLLLSLGDSLNLDINDTASGSILIGEKTYTLDDGRVITQGDRTIIIDSEVKILYKQLTKTKYIMIAKAEGSKVRYVIDKPPEGQRNLMGEMQADPQEEEKQNLTPKEQMLLEKQKLVAQKQAEFEQRLNRISNTRNATELLENNPANTTNTAQNSTQAANTTSVSLGSKYDLLVLGKKPHRVSLGDDFVMAAKIFKKGVNFPEGFEKNDGIVNDVNFTARLIAPDGTTYKTYDVSGSNGTFNEKYVFPDNAPINRWNLVFRAEKQFDDGTSVDEWQEYFFLTERYGVSCDYTPAARVDSVDTVSYHYVNEGVFPTITLNGSRSFDPSGCYQYRWSLPEMQNMSNADPGIRYPGALEHIILDDPTSLTASFVAPLVGQTQDFDFTLTLINGAISVSDTVKVTIENQCWRPPMPDAGGDQMETFDGTGVPPTIELTGIPDDDAGCYPEYMWTLISEQPEPPANILKENEMPGMIDLMNPTSLMASFAAPLVGETQDFVFNFTISNTYLSKSDSTTVTINNPCYYPPMAGVVEAMGEVTYTDKDNLPTVALNGTSTDVNMCYTDIEWTLDDPMDSNLMLSATNVLQPTFTVPEVEDSKTFTFTLTVKNERLMDMAQVAITVVNGTMTIPSPVVPDPMMPDPPMPDPMMPDPPMPDPTP